MAYASLVSLAQTIEKFLEDDDQHSTSPHEKQQIISIHGFMTFLQTFLEDFPDKTDKVLEGRIRDLANETEDIIEYRIWEQMRQQYSSGSSAEFVRAKKELQEVAEEIDLIAREVMEIKNSFRIKDAQLIDSSAAASSSRLVPTNKDVMVGFDDNLTAIKARLCGESSKLQVIPILGMGGIGKTTLARNVFDDPLTVEHFDIRAWVTVSQNYSTKRILLTLWDSINAFTYQREERDEVKKEDVYKRLKGWRYLIVMDDMWSTEVWDDVRMIFPDDRNGSRIMLTTRLSDVATYPDSFSPIHEMLFMDTNQSWGLLKQKVFPQVDCPLELESIGWEIAKCCRGLPLAVVVIAGLLSTVGKTRASWESMARNVRPAVTKDNEKFADIVLHLSYNHLPQHLRPCFLYMGVFPEDYEIRVSRLIKLCVAEGFLKPSGSKRFEEVAEEYVEDLVKRSLVLVIKRKSNGKIKSCGIHELVRDLCITKAQEEKFFQHVMNREPHNIKDLARDLCITKAQEEMFFEHVMNRESHNIKDQRRVRIDISSLIDFPFSTIHTILCNNGSRGSLRVLRNVRLLRVLDAVNEVFPNIRPIFELFHLRYLAFEFDYPTKIPQDVANLKNLQTLIFHPRRRNEPPSLVCLPLEIWRIPQLRHLLISFGELPNPEGATFALENLQTLSEVTNFICTEEILKTIPNLKKLGISYFGDKYVEDYRLDNLVYMHQLEKLKLKIYAGFSFQQKVNPIFPTTLRKLTLSGWRVAWIDLGKTVGSLPNLEVLKLRDLACDGDIWETNEGEFVKLKFLLIDYSFLEEWITESSHFPSLKCLVLKACRYLSEIPEVIGEIPTLELIEVDIWNKSLMESAKRIQQEQLENWGNDAIQVKIVPDY